MRKTVCILCLLFIINISVSAHPGGTDKYGGHTEKATGRYHIHNPDGTITYTEKPTETPSAPATTPVEPNNSNNTTQNETPQTVTVNGEEKPLQQGVTPVESVDSVQSVAPDKPNVYTHQENESVWKTLGPFWLILLILFAVIGVSAISFVLLLALKKLEKKNPALDYIILIPMLVVFIPAMLGCFLYKLAQKLDPPDKEKEKQDNFI